MQRSHLNDMKVPKAKPFIPRGFQLKITLSYAIWSTVNFPEKLGLKTDTFLTPIMLDEANLVKSYS